MSSPRFFSGSFKVEGLTEAQRTYLTAFYNVRHMKRNVSLLTKPDEVREAVGLPLGVDGEFYVAGDGVRGQVHTYDITNYNLPPAPQPSLWCGWGLQGDSLVFDAEGGQEPEKWIEYMVRFFFNPWGVRLNGEVIIEDEEGETGGIRITDNVVEIAYE